jgi:ABC-type dipeptide/oligopeptide/nickel transport system permease component
MQIAPGDPVKKILKIDEVAITHEEEEALRRELGFDRPIIMQYFDWIKQIVKLDFGESYITKQPVWDEMVSKLPNTIYLTIGALAVAIVIAVPLGVLSAVYHHRLIDHISRMLALIGASVPDFWLGLLLIFLLSYHFNLLPSLGGNHLLHLILPSVTLGLAMAAVYARLLRAGLLESLSQEYIRAANARGLRQRSILFRHALKGAMIPVITMFGMSFGSLLGGSVVVETLFSWPGLGKMIVDAILKRDYPVIQGYILFTGTFVFVVNMLVDITYRFLDPRLRLEKGYGK